MLNSFPHSPNLPSVLGDPVYLQTLFLNLITNALDAMTHGGSLTVKAQQIPSLTTLENGKCWRSQLPTRNRNTRRVEKKDIRSLLYDEEVGTALDWGCPSVRKSSEIIRAVRSEK